MRRDRGGVESGYRREFIRLAVESSSLLRLCSIFLLLLLRSILHGFGRFLYTDRAGERRYPLEAELE